MAETVYDYHVIQADETPVLVNRDGRRRFDEALAVVPKEARKESTSYLIIKQIQAIYREEGKLKDLPSEERPAQRQVVVKPLADALFAYLK